MKIKKNKLLFVSIASYRDSQLLPTVQNMIKNATFPERLVVCICLQDENEKINLLSNHLNSVVSSRNAHLKLLTMPYESARGPTWARYMIQREWQGEEFFLQIDSHMRFIPAWDKSLLHSLSLCGSGGVGSKKVLTNYGNLYDHITEYRDGRYREALRVVRIDQSDGFFRFNSLFKEQPSRPVEGYCWSGCFSFSSSSLICDAPYDPYTPYLFFGEEIDISARLYNLGWRFFSPEKPIVYTTFVRNYRPVYWKDHPHQKFIEQLSRLRLYYRFGLISSKEIPSELTKDSEQYFLGIKNYSNYLTKAQKYRYSTNDEEV